MHAPGIPGYNGRNKEGARGGEGRGGVAHVAVPLLSPRQVLNQQTVHQRIGLAILASPSARRGRGLRGAAAIAQGRVHLHVVEDDLHGGAGDAGARRGWDRGGGEGKD